MKSFADNAGRTWAVQVNVDTIKRVQGLLDVNLLDVVDGDLIERLVADPVLVCDVVYVVCKPEADKQGVSDEEFGRAMAGDAIHNAADALLAEIVDFFPPAKRKILAAALEKMRDLEAVAMGAALERINDTDFETKLREQLAAEFGK